MADTKITLVRPSGQILALDMDLAYAAEAKLIELPTANSGNALYLSSVFGRAYNQLGRAYGLLCRESELATVMSRKRRAILALDIAPVVLKEKGLATARNAAGSADLRESVCYSDDEYCKIEEYRAGVDAAKELIAIKLQTCKMAFYAIQAILKTSQGAAGNSVHDLGSSGEGDLIGRVLSQLDTSELPSTNQVTGFGVPKRSNG